MANEILEHSKFHFNTQVLDCVVGGVSALDVSRLNVPSDAEAKQFVQAYGYDLDDSEQHDQLWASHRRALSLIKEQLIDPGEEIPEVISDPSKLASLTQLLQFASMRSTTPEERELQKWSCAILKVMHVDVHLRNDLFSAFRDEIQAQILRPIQSAIHQDEAVGLTIVGPAMADGGVKLHKFEIKPFKTTASSVIKLLARPERVALTLLDKLGVRFVTRSVLDSFRVIRFLVDQHIVSYPHIMPDQSSNTLYPVNLFREVMDEIDQKILAGEPEPSTEEVQDLLRKSLDEQASRAQYLAKPNQFSDPDYRFIKFINRKLITVSIGAAEQTRAFRFFYPYEIQIMDYDTYVKNLTGPLAHDEYKNRQRIRARERVFGQQESGSES